MSLEQAEKHALELLADGLRQRFGTALWRVSLFGSKARGDDDPSSDIDVIVVLREPVAEEAKATVSEAVYGVMEACGVYISTVVVSDREFERPTGQLRWLVSFVQEVRSNALIDPESAAHQFLQQATATLEEARVLLAGDHPGGAINRSYYAAFYAACALLDSVGLKARSPPRARGGFDTATRFLHAVKTRLST